MTGGEVLKNSSKKQKKVPLVCTMTLPEVLEIFLWDYGEILEILD